MVIRMRHTRAHTKNRRSHHALKEPTLVVCNNCQAKRRPHHMCLECGFYNGKMIIDLKARKAKRESKRAEKLRARSEAQSDFSNEEEHQSNDDKGTESESSSKSVE